MTEQKHDDARGASRSDAVLCPMPDETLAYWIDAYTSMASGLDFAGHGMLVQAAREYQALRATARRAIDAWDSTVLPRSNDGMMQERMEDLRATLGHNAKGKQPATTNATRDENNG